MSRWRVLVLALVLLLVLTQPALAQGGEGGRVIFGQDFTLRGGDVLRGDLVVFGGDILLEPGSRVDGDVLALGGSVRAGGEIEGDVFALGGDMYLSASARVAGDVLTSGRLSQEPGAVVRGRVMEGRRQSPELWSGRWWSPRFGSWPWWGFGPWWDVRSAVDWLARTLLALFCALGMAALGAVVVLLAPGPTRIAAEAFVAHPGESLGVGLLTLLAAVLVLPVLVLICIGIPVALVATLALVIGGVYGWIVAGLALGERLLGALRQPRSPVVAVALGLLILAALLSIFCLGALVFVFVGAWGLGAVVLTRFGTMPYRQGPAAPRAPAPPAIPPAPPQSPAEPPPGEPPAPAEA
ncbi:MAG: polymer-forming cytoskeletal protein [Anaerolineae bacterium]|nr:polymer-forming cytoskeletal protein [Anaerolineae bacterium]